MHTAALHTRSCTVSPLRSLDKPLSFTTIHALKDILSSETVEYFKTPVSKALVYPLCSARSSVDASLAIPDRQLPQQTSTVVTFALIEDRNRCQ